MRYLLIFMLLIGVFVLGKKFIHFNLGAGVSGTGPDKTEVRDVRDFHGVEASFSGDVEVSQDGNYYVEVTAKESILPVLKTEVRDGILHIFTKGAVWYSGKMEVRVKMPAADRFVLDGSGNLHVLNAFSGQEIQVDLDGSGNIEFLSAAFDKMACTISGSGDIELGGRTGALKVEIDGSGAVDASKLQAQTADVNVSGSGSVDCQVAENLKVDISGSGHVSYSGDASVQKDISGSGGVSKRN